MDQSWSITELCTFNVKLRWIHMDTIQDGSWSIFSLQTILPIFPLQLAHRIVEILGAIRRCRRQEPGRWCHQGMESRENLGKTMGDTMGEMRLIMVHVSLEPEWRASNLGGFPPQKKRHEVKRSRRWLNCSAVSIHLRIQTLQTCRFNKSQDDDATSAKVAWTPAGEWDTYHPICRTEKAPSSYADSLDKHPSTIIYLYILKRVLNSRTWGNPTGRIRS